MLRRDIFNLFLKGTSLDTAVLSAAEPPINLSTYFKKDDTILINQEWNPITCENGLIKPDVSPAHEFSITLNLNYANSLPAVCHIGIKGDSHNIALIKMGFNESRKLFIGDKIDERILPLESLKRDFQLILNVIPLKNGMTHAKLKAVDHNGLTLSIVKSDNIKSIDWSGDIDVSLMSCNSLTIQGRKLI